MKKILITTGGTGGHVIPSLIIYEHLKDNFDVQLVSDYRGSKFIDKNQYKFELIDVPNITKFSLKLPVNLVFFLISFFKSITFIKKYNFDILFSTGGYMSLPLCIASIILNKRLILFEPNKVLGRSNRFVLIFSKKIICYHEKIKNYPIKNINKIFLIENLLKKDVYKIDKNKVKKISSDLNLLILGGSQGALFFDKSVQNLIKKLNEKYKVKLIQQIFSLERMKDLKKMYDEINVSSYLFTYDQYLYKKLNSIDLAITRCGASALGELSYFNIPFIAIPYPYAKDNHQFYNAKHYEDKNCCWMLEQKNFSIDKLAIFIDELISNQSDYLEKKENLMKISYQNSWNNINKKLTQLFNEN